MKGALAWYLLGVGIGLGLAICVVFWIAAQADREEYVLVRIPREQLPRAPERKLASVSPIRPRLELEQLEQLTRAPSSPDQGA